MKLKTFQSILSITASIIFMIFSVLIILANMSDNQKMYILLLMIVYTCIGIANSSIEIWQRKKIDKKSKV